jgi:hypothetical protein
MSELLDLFQTLLPYLQKGAYGTAAGTLLMALVRVYRIEALQRFLPKRARWDSLPAAAKVALPFLLALVGSFVVSVGAGATALSSLLSAFPVALAAIGMHHGTKALGQAMTNGALKMEGPSYTPSKFRKLNSIIVPLGKTPQDIFDRMP